MTKISDRVLQVLQTEGKALRAKEVAKILGDVSTQQVASSFGYLINAEKITRLSSDRGRVQVVKTGVPEGFYRNTCLVNINKRSLAPDQRDKVPTKIKCWNEQCDEPSIVCGYPFYICENRHVINVETGEKWNWVPTDEVYHGLLNILQGHIEPTYQKLFEANSRKIKDTEASQLSSHLGSVGRHLYDKLKVDEPDPYNWGRDEYRHNAGIRFAINMMNRAIFTRCRGLVHLPSEDLPEDARAKIIDRGGWQGIYEFDAQEWEKIFGPAHLKEMLLSLQNLNVPKKLRQTTLV